MCVCVAASNEEVACFVRPLNNVGEKTTVRVACFVLKLERTCENEIQAA